jgi:hypothetical protein
MKAEIGKRYRHYKGGEYTVLAVGRMEPNPSQEYVVYRMEYDAPDFPKGTVWLRERSNFEEMVVVDGETVPRFTVIS